MLCAHILLVIIYCVHICCWWLYMLCAYMLLVIIYVVCIYVVGDYICYVHICCWWIYLTCYWWWIVGVSMYWNMLVWICRIRMKYVLLFSSPKFTHSCCWISSPSLVANTFVFNYAGWLCGVIMMFSWHQGRRPRRWCNALVVIYLFLIYLESFLWF